MSIASDIINNCYDLAKMFRNEDKYEAAFGAEAVGNLVNNVHHGLYVQEWLPQVVTLVKEGVDNSDSLPAGWHEGYVLASQFVEEAWEKFQTATAQ